ncbi:GNAT family N-acetyltransferase [Algibacter sp. 2305UL17-15]|uniref:GNAT family N-acetyltransferase n=1 Tax=Algibacter sp. 2305UL17-15 TaxID=3231268 RepID=UPI00345A5B45
MKQNYDIKQINAEDTYTVRHPILRAGKPIATCAFDGDDLESTIHLGLFSNNNLIGVASFMKNKNEWFNNKLQYQLRGMALLKEHQGLGLGKMMLSYGENLLKLRNIKIVWCNARETALNFYKQNDYSTIGKPFEIAEIGVHYTMYKYL